MTACKHKVSRGAISEEMSTGVSTISGAVNLVVVDHGLSTTPTKVLVTPGITGVGLFFVDTIGATQFTINFANQPGGATWIFYWQAIE